MITIGFDAKRAFKNFSGLGNYSRSLIRALAHFYPQNKYVLYTPPYKPHPVLKPLEDPHIVIRTPRGAGAWSPSLWRSGGLGFSSALRKDGIRLFHGLSGELPYGIAKTLPMVVTMHDLIFMRYPDFYKPIDRLIYEKKFRYACRRADKIIAISKQTRDDLIQFLNADPQKIEIVYQGCDPQFYQQPGPEICAAVRAKYQLPEQFILSVGTIEERKNLTTLIRAMAALPDSFHLVALGKATSYMEQVDREIERQKLASRVHILHHAWFSDFPAIYACARALVYPSVFEGFGIPVLEGLNIGIPVVTSNVSSMPEAGGDAAAYIHPLDADEMAGTILRILEDSSLASDMAAKGRQYALRFREEQIANNIYNVYNQLISSYE